MRHHNPRKSTKIASTAAGVAVAIAVITWLAARQANTTLPSHTISEVTRGDIVRKILATGHLAPLGSVEVSTQTSGLVVDVNVDFNSPVRQGQIIARIDSSTYKQRLRQAEADIAAAEASHALASLNYRRMLDLANEDLITQQALDESAAELEQSRSMLLTRRAGVENARVDLDRCTIRSPIDGIVIFKTIEVGKTVAATFNAPTLFVIARDRTAMQIIAPINEVDITGVTIGQKVEFTVDAFVDRRFSGAVVQIRDPYTPESSQNPTSVQSNLVATYNAVISVESSDPMLRPGLTANLEIVRSRRANVLRIPTGATRVSIPSKFLDKRSRTSLDARSDSTLVYRPADAGAFKSVPVKLGASDGIFTEVLSGLEEDDVIVSSIATSASTPRRTSIFQW